jgi:hypothetical protein
MFSILNELKDNSPSSVIGVVGSSIGSAASIYIVVAITGYITFGNAVVGNIVSMCKCSSWSILIKQLTNHRSYRSCFDDRKGGYCRSRHLLGPVASPSLPSFTRCRLEVATQPSLFGQQTNLNPSTPYDSCE